MKISAHGQELFGVCPPSGYVKHVDRRVGGAEIRRAEHGFAGIVSSIRIAVFISALNTRIGPPALVLPRFSFSSS